MFATRSLRAAGIALSAAVITVACGSTGSGNTPTAVDIGSGKLSGAGSTYVSPFFQAAFYAYNQLHPAVSADYQSIGSGGGIQQFTKNTVDFGASDVPMNPTEIQAAGGPDSLVQIPVVLGVEGMGYNLSGIDKLQLDGPAVANIYLGHITKWNDPAVQTLNPGVNLPNKAITVVHRSDGSGTTYIFTDYLSNVSDEWKTKVGTGKAVQWPTGVGGKGNEGVGNQVQQIDGAIGYIELAFIVQSKLQMVYLKNSAGKFLQASAAGAAAAAAQAKGNLSPTNFSIVNMSGTDSYPISGFTWAMLRTSYTDSAKGKALVYLFKWVVGDGQQYGKALSYAPFPSEASQLAVDTLKKVQAAGSPVLS